MTDVLDGGPAEAGSHPNPASMIEAAERAAAADDYPEAERLLREAAALQEATVGSEHPDVASTLNNLAFVCERLGKLDDAERGYRRAHAIAVASLGPGHPFIKTSLTNLVEFCAARGIPLWAPPAARADDEEETGDPLDEPPEPEVIARRRFPWLASAAAALAVVATVAAVMRQGRDTTNAPPPAPPALDEPSPAAPPADPTPNPVPAIEPEPPAPAEKRPAAPVSALTVLNAQLCTAIERTGTPDWECVPAAGGGPPGTYSFYTRLLTKADTTVEHRWYFDGRVHQTMRLRVRPSPGNGYRTFSSNTVSPERAGQWRVELRAADGSVLREERFVVQ